MSRANLLAQFGQLGLRILGLGTSLVVVIVLARYLGPAQYGSLTAGLTLASLAYGVMDSGIFPLGVRRISGGAPPLHVAKMMTRSRLIMLAVISPLVVAVAVVAGNDSSLILLVCALSTVPYAYTSYRAVAEATVKPLLVGVLLASQNIAWLALVLVAVATNLDVTTLAFMSVAACAVQAILSWLTARLIAPDDGAFGPNRVTARDLIREAWPLVWSSLAVTAYYRGSQLAVFSFSAPEDGASYLAAFRLLDAAQVLPATIISVLLPRLVNALRSNAAPARLFMQYFAFTMTASVFVSVTVLLFSDFIATVLLGPKYSTAPTYLSIAFCAFPFIAGAYVLTSSLIALNRERLIAFVSAAIAVLGFCAVTASAWLGGPEVAGYAVVSVEVVHFTGLLIALFFQTRKGWYRDAS
ncbi:oligosaccharide flippase family protein [Microbacterium sp. SORGH_AS_0888]|uniref:oligosaccharide flippase family protein n=1 Tax=Microbacterium sp. SORGH_AS_0888 TaxID=3041791 RepID=UPI002787448F|nr:oligosaccharide flippase family protein [Microbacterium sp. SORGH_AS_0888]MDQ1130465.1 PST family polysaccharide transporter [Microbacterium sp. SORGH_AS_0888]